MAVNKVSYGGNTLIDLTSDSVTPDKLASGVTAHDKSGNKITGTMSANVKRYEITLAKASSWVLLTTLDDEVLAHINDASLVVSLVNISPHEYVSYAMNIAICSNSHTGMANSYPIYGVSYRTLSATGINAQYAYYPANKTDTSRTLGGFAFRVSGGKYYICPVDGYVRAGTYLLTFTW